MQVDYAIRILSANFNTCAHDEEKTRELINGLIVLEAYRRCPYLITDVGDVDVLKKNL